MCVSFRGGNNDDGKDVIFRAKVIYVQFNATALVTAKLN